MVTSVSVVYYDIKPVVCIIYSCTYGEMDIIERNGHNNPSSNPGQGCLHFT